MLKFKSKSEEKLNRLNSFKGNMNQNRACSSVSLNKNNKSNLSLNETILSELNLNYSQNDETLQDDLRLLKRKYGNEKNLPFNAKFGLNESNEQLSNKTDTISFKMPKTVDRIVERLDILKVGQVSSKQNIT